MQMDLLINFAKPVGPYDMAWNKCVSTYCHVEISIELEKDLFMVLIDSNVSSAHNPTMLETLLKRLRRSRLKKVHVCFYIMWGDVVSIRFLDDLNEDPLMRPPEPPIYDKIEVPLTMEQMQSVVGYSLRQLGKPYDIPRAILLLTSITLRTDPNVVPSNFFCSQLVMHTLKAAGIYAEEIKSCRDINHMTPLDVYQWLVDQKMSSITMDDESKNGSGSAKSDGGDETNDK